MTVELQEIARRCGLPIRLVRYVLDHPVLPGSSPTRSTNERGQPRKFTELEAFAIGIAAHLLHAGIKRPNVARAISEIVESKFSLHAALGVSPLGAIRSYDKPSVMRIGPNGHLISVSLDGVVAPGPHAGAHRADVVSVDIDLAAIRVQLFPKKPRD